MKFLSSLSNKQLAGKTVLVRLDLNVAPADISHSIRVQRAIATVQFLRERNARVIMVSHRGRPVPLKKEEIVHTQSVTSHKFSQEKIAPDITLGVFKNIFQKALGEKVVFFNHFDFKKIRADISSNTATVFLLENMRLLAGEEQNSKALARSLASLADMYVNDAFAVSHRAHASIEAIAHVLPSYAGIELEQELVAFKRVQQKTVHPLVLLLGGIKISDKIGVIRSFAHAEAVLTGGGIANTLFAARGEYVGTSLYEKNVLLDNVMQMKNVLLPLDVVWHEGKILDIGRATAREYGEVIQAARMVVWNGPMGLTEQKKFSAGTRALWRAVCASPAFVIIGGGETTSFIESIASVSQLRSSHIFLSIGGGAMLAYLSGKKLPGIEALG